MHYWVWINEYILYPFEPNIYLDWENNILRWEGVLLFIIVDLYIMTAVTAFNPSVIGNQCSLF